MSRYFKIAPQPPGPGFPEHAPSELDRVDALLKTDRRFDRWLIVGHWPVMLYGENIVCANPIIDRERDLARAAFLRGIPTANADKTLAVWLKPQIFQMDPSDEIVNILFLDEISAAPQSVQAAAYQITLDRVVGEHKLPDNCIVIAAGNRVTDKSVSFKMPKALANRLLHIEVEGSFLSWQNWALKAGVHPKVLGFLCARTDLLFGFDAKNDDLAFATPRSWEMVSNLLNHVSDNVNEMYPLIAGLVGNGTALEFRSWCSIHFRLPKTEDIFMGKQVKVPKETDLLYAVISSMIAYAKDHKDDLWQIGNSLRYAAGFPADFVTLLTDHYEMMDKHYAEVLRSLPEYYELSAKRGRVRNGQV